MVVARALQLTAPMASAGQRAPAGGLIALRSSFVSSSVRLLKASVINPSRFHSSSSLPKISMRLASKQAYICRDCGYIYNDRTPFDKLPDGFFCPVCGAPKRRFRVYENSVAKNANAADVRKARKADIKRDEGVGRALPIAIAVGIIALVAIYLYLNSAYQG